MSRRRGAILLLEAVLVVLALSLGLWVRARVATDWTFVGADGYNYMGAASELAEKHRFGIPMPLWYPNRPRETPPGYCRMPGYPIFLAALIHAPVRKYEEVFVRTKPAQRVLDLLTCLLVFFAARGLGGRPAAWPAFLCALCNPFLALFSAAILTETLATFLTTLALVGVLWAMDRRLRPWHGWLLVGAGVVMALGQLVRIDGCLLLPLLFLPLFVTTSAVRLRTVVVSLLAFLLVYGPWPLRNLLVFSHPHPLAGVCDVRGKTIPHTAFFGWFATWLVKEEQTPPTLYCFFREECVSSTRDYPSEAFDSAAEREEVARLFSLRAKEGLSPRVDAGFRALTWQRIRRHPLRSLLFLPARRAYHLWVSSNDQPLRATTSLPWPRAVSLLRPWFRVISATTLLWGILGLFFVAVLSRFREQRGAAWLGVGVLVLRTGFLSLIGFVDARYVLEVLPFLLVFAGVATAQILRWPLTWLRPPGTRRRLD